MSEPLFSEERGRVLTLDKVRTLDTNALGLQAYSPRIEPPTIELTAGDEIDAPEMGEEDPLYFQVIELLADGYAGVIFTGPPGTSKSHYAAEIGKRLVDNDEKRIRFIQFHPSYQYEDFVEGFVPTEQGFELKKKHLLEMCDIANEAGDELCVLVIDELSRADPGRVFGEALTYIETTKRGVSFRLSSSRVTSIPRNLVFLATMNPYDRGVDEIDAALERRFAKIAMDPSDAHLVSILERNQMNGELQDRVRRFFRDLQKNPNLYSRIGHAYFVGVRDEAGLWRLWRHQLRFVMERAFRHDRDSFHGVESAWKRIFADASAPDDSSKTDE